MTEMAGQLVPLADALELLAPDVVVFCEVAVESCEIPYCEMVGAGADSAL